jgi:hypothetical protein
VPAGTQATRRLAGKGEGFSRVHRQDVHSANGSEGNKLWGYRGAQVNQYSGPCKRSGKWSRSGLCANKFPMKNKGEKDPLLIKGPREGSFDAKKDQKK